MIMKTDSIGVQKNLWAQRWSGNHFRKVSCLVPRPGSLSAFPTSPHSKFFDLGCTYYYNHLLISTRSGNGYESGIVLGAFFGFFGQG
jgi:hypothetical protein